MLDIFRHVLVLQTISRLWRYLLVVDVYFVSPCWLRIVFGDARHVRLPFAILIVACRETLHGVHILSYEDMPTVIKHAKRYELTFQCCLINHVILCEIDVDNIAFVNSSCWRKSISLYKYIYYDSFRRILSDLVI